MSASQQNFESSVLQRMKKIERLLKDNYQAVGDGLGKKAISVEHKLDSDTIKKLRFIAAVRNKIFHEEDYVYDGDENDFLRTCDEIIRRLNVGPAQQASKPAPPPKPTHTPPPRKANTTTSHAQQPSSHRPSNHHPYSNPSSSGYAPRTPSPGTAEGHSPAVALPAFKFIIKASLIVATVSVVLYVGSAVISTLVSQVGRTTGGRGGGGQTVWTMMGVNTTMLNVRSGPGTDSPVIARFGRGSRLAITGEPVKNGNEYWIKVSTDDGGVQGWANRKFLSASPQLQSQEPPTNQETPTAGQPTPTELPTSTEKELSSSLRQKCQELVDRSFVELAVEIPPECDEQLRQHYQRLRENMNARSKK